MADLKRRPHVQLQALRLLRPIAAREGPKIRAARQRRRWTQRELGQRCGLSQQSISQLERGDGATLSLAAWQRVALTLGLSLDLKLGRDALEEPRDAGHLQMQELVLRLSRAHSPVRRVELPNRASDPTRWSDVAVVDDLNKRLTLYECVNVFGDIGAAVRSSDRKASDAAALIAGRDYAVHACWIVRDTRRNRELVARYPELFEAAFPGSSRAWAAALTSGSPPPTERGLIWCYLNATRVFARRRAKIAA